jgi:AAA+ ATPase superfamily predicted ATPase
MTRNEYLRKLREEFIDRHLALPGWMERLPPWLREYFRILYWVFFRPSALRLYLTRLAQEGGMEEAAGWKPLRLPSVRSLVLRGVILTLVLPPVMVLLTGWGLSALGVPFEWIGAFWGVALSVAWGVGWGVAWGVALGVALSVAEGVAFGVALGVAGGVAGGVALGVAGGVAGGVALGVAGGVAGSAAEGVALSVALSVAFGVALSVALSMAFDVALSVVLSVALSVASGVIWGVAFGVAGGVASGVAVLIGTLLGLARFPFWFWEVFLPRPPISWDELPILPWPGLPGWLVERLKHPGDAAWWFSFVARHPYARWAISRAASRQPAGTLWSVPLLRHLLRNPLPYVEPQASEDPDVRRREADPCFSSKLVLAELGGVRAIPGFSDTLARFLTKPLRRPLPAPLAHFFRAWYHLLEAAAPTDPKSFDPNRLVEALKEAREASSALGEAAEELPALLNALVSLAESPRIGVLPLFPCEAPNFPEVLKGLCLFEKATQAFTAYQAASGELARRDYLNEALSALERARQMAAESPDVPQPFAALLLLISERWHQTVAAERDRLLALRPVSPLEDFYVAGPPLTPESGRLFVGRDEIFQRLEELFRNPFQKGPVVLYGQRRIGKTSILRHIGVRLGPSYIPVLADLQGLLFDPYRPIRSDRDLWLALMREIGKPLGVSPREGESVEEFLDRIAPARRERFIVLMLDEFEKLERWMDEGAVSRGFLEYLRHLIQHRPELLVVLSGHHTLQERVGRYWEPLMGVARSVWVSYLEGDAARRLITAPWNGFRLQYTEESVQRLMMATGCQPMLLQLACSAVIQEVNNRMKREGYEVYPTARPEEVERALDQLLREGETWYFDAVWDWLTEEQRAALIRLAQAYRPGSEGWILWQEVPGVTGDIVRALEVREVLEVEDGRCRFRVELLRRWLACRSPSVSLS